jgi:hypothetical protein
MHHETRNTLEVTAWCNKCGRRTQHRVDDRRRGPCLEHESVGMTKAQERRQKLREKEEREPRLL